VRVGQYLEQGLHDANISAFSCNMQRSDATSSCNIDICTFAYKLVQHLLCTCVQGKDSQVRSLKGRYGSRLLLEILKDQA